MEAIFVAIGAVVCLIIGFVSFLEFWNEMSREDCGYSIPYAVAILAIGLQFSFVGGIGVYTLFSS